MIQDRIPKTEVSFANGALALGFASPCVVPAWRLRPFLQWFGGAFDEICTFSSMFPFTRHFTVSSTCRAVVLGLFSPQVYFKGWISLESPRDGSPSDWRKCRRTQDVIRVLGAVTQWPPLAKVQFMLGVCPVSFVFLGFSTGWVQLTSASTVTLYGCRSCGFCPSRLAPSSSFRYLGGLCGQKTFGKTRRKPAWVETPIYSLLWPFPC